MWYRSNLEEMVLLERFGDAYRAYRARTGRFLPRLGRATP
jgi:protein-S-isoprenylcysteine O-methyltransferase Ste14